MSKKIQLSIPTPCHENWDVMTQVQKGKFCGSCQKQVVDFSNMSDRQVAEFFKKPSTGSVCGRFMTDQLDRSIEIPKKRIPWVKYFFQIALPAFLVTIKSSAQKTQGKIKVNTVATDTTRKRVELPPTMGLVARIIDVKGDIKIDTTVAPVIDPTCTDVVMGKVMMPARLKEIKGKIIDENGDPLPGATIMIKGTRIGVAADAEGAFTLKPGAGMDKIVLVGSYIAYEVTELIVDRNNYTGSVILQLKKPSQCFLVGELVVTRKPAIKKEIKEVPLMSSVNHPATGSIKVFPNPAASGSSITIEWKQSEEGYYSLQLLNSSGQQAYNKEIWIDADARLLNINLPSLSAGSYSIVLGNKKTGKKFTEKIIIQ